jgi:uncharacterized protein (DUF885 family)
MRRTILLLAILLAPAMAMAESGDETTRLHALFDKEWEWRLQEFPTMATNVGRHEWNDRLPSASPAAQRRRAEMRAHFLKEIDALDRSQLSDTDQINYDMFRRQLALALEDFKYGGYQIPLNADSGFHSGFARLATRVPLNTTRDYDNYIARINGFERLVEQNINLMQLGIQRGMVLPKVVLKGIEGTIEAHIVEDHTESSFWKPFVEFPSSVPESDHERLREAGRQAIVESAVPAYQTFLEFMVDTYIPAARESLGASELPDGLEYYQSEIRRYTTLDLTPDEIHQIGLDEVARIRAEMSAIIEKVGFEGTFAEFLEFLRTDPRFYPTSAEQLLKEASYIAKRMDAKLPSLFKTLPRLPYGVEPVPEAIAPKYTAGRYVGAPVGGTQPGYYWVNTYGLESRTLYTLEALTLHEAVPGHHLQSALSREQEDLPNFRRYSYISAFGEGWGLYSEWLGIEAGFYTDPYSDFGRLTYEMWRAARLVVDTGVHAKGWTRQQVVDFLSENTALALHEIQTETDRYISWPAQALSYKLGEIKIKELRKKAEEALGTHFDVREFHDAVLLNGSVPLPVLEDQIDKFIQARLPAS